MTDKDRLFEAYLSLCVWLFAGAGVLAIFFESFTPMFVCFVVLAIIGSLVWWLMRD